MPEKDFGLWVALWDSLPAPLRAAIAGAFVALLRVMYDDREPRMARRLLECALCGAISLCVALLGRAFEVNPDLSTFAGGAIGLLGADKVRSLARRVAERRVKGLGGDQ